MHHEPGPVNGHAHAAHRVVDEREERVVGGERVGALLDRAVAQERVGEAIGRRHRELLGQERRDRFRTTVLVDAHAVEQCGALGEAACGALACRGERGEGAAGGLLEALERGGRRDHERRC
jgi:hypothetical protein